MEEQTKTSNWLAEEETTLKTNSTYSGERKEALKIEDKQMCEVDVDFTKKFDSWIDPANPTTIKKIIPVKHTVKDVNGKDVVKDLVFWLNPANPVYREIVQAGLKGITHFKIMRMGTAKQTRYVLMK